MADINRLIRERRAIFRNFKRSLKPIDTAIEKAQRFVDRKLRLRRDVPTIEDIQQYETLLNEIANNLNAAMEAAMQGTNFFNLQ